MRELSVTLSIRQVQLRSLEEEEEAAAGGRSGARVAEQEGEAFSWVIVGGAHSLEEEVAPVVSESERGMEEEEAAVDPVVSEAERGVEEEEVAPVVGEARRGAAWRRWGLRARTPSLLSLLLDFPLFLSPFCVRKQNTRGCVAWKRGINKGGKRGCEGHSTAFLWALGNWAMQAWWAGMLLPNRFLIRALRFLPCTRGHVPLDGAGGDVKPE
ncbi:Os06g0168300 [Oryza sativa Japonica Group]|uniref:Os06g0168300 protein n=1 Tax=Oryza sativa subsp. japonica TaxID=39947 RepID=A0A0P0WSW8_ORYSJ|nr:Os06g0168300 [Oryza sativa Japonica Group]